MGTFNQSLTTLRYFLRDPDGDIWSDADIVRYFNQAQYEIQQKGRLLERVSVTKWPPEFNYSYTHDWEKSHGDGSRFRCLQFWQAGQQTICYPWEPSVFLTNSDISDDGYRFTHPFEGAGFVSPADYVPAPLNEQFDRMRFIAFDNEPIEGITQVELANSDPYYRTHSGSPQNYWRPDDYSNLFVLYPRPAAVVWQDWSPDDSFSDTLGEGIVAWTEAELDYLDEGIITDAIDSDDAIFMVYDILPGEVDVDDPGSWDDTLDWPEYILKYVEYATLERCFGADTDGFIPSLRDFWKVRKEIGLNAIKQFKAMREADRTYRIGGMERLPKSRLRFPSGYPPG